ncbi:MAG: DUF4249 family protein [Bacteroidetes bacterium]|nr:DUF4249 family protein [Bacteroidota bacterium]
MSKYILLLLLPFTFLLASCGDPDVELESSSYQPKIVIEGYLYPGTSPANIRISRNFRLNSPLDASSILLPDAQVKLTRLSDGRQATLVFNPISLAFEYAGTDWIVGNQEHYKIEVTAIIDGKTLSAAGETTTPSAGFALDLASTIAGSITYNEKNPDGTYKTFKLGYTPSPGVDFYAIGVTALDAKVDQFIYTPVNRYGSVEEKDSSDIRESLNSLKYSREGILNYSTSGLQEYDLEWYLFNFYGNYRIVIFATDLAAKNFLLTHKDVQDTDGNFVEPKMNISGDGIGVFGSAITDTMFIEIKKP